MEWFCLVDSTYWSCGVCGLLLLCARIRLITMYMPHSLTFGKFHLFVELDDGSMLACTELRIPYTCLTANSSLVTKHYTYCLLNRFQYPHTQQLACTELLLSVHISHSKIFLGDQALYLLFVTTGSIVHILSRLQVIT